MGLIAWQSLATFRLLTWHMSYDNVGIPPCSSFQMQLRAMKVLPKNQRWTWIQNRDDHWDNIQWNPAIPNPWNADTSFVRTVCSGTECIPVDSCTNHPWNADTPLFRKADNVLFTKYEHSIYNNTNYEWFIWTVQIHQENAFSSPLLSTNLLLSM